MAVNTAPRHATVGELGVGKSGHAAGGAAGGNQRARQAVDMAGVATNGRHDRNVSWRQVIGLGTETTVIALECARRHAAIVAGRAIAGNATARVAEISAGKCAVGTDRNAGNVTRLTTQSPHVDMVAGGCHDRQRR